MNRSRLSALLVAAVAAVSVAGCGGSSHSSSTSTSSTVSTSTSSSSTTSAAPAPAQVVYQTPYGPSLHAPGFGIPPSSGPGVKAIGVVSGIPLVSMFDSVTISQIPSSASYVLGYTTGLFPTYGPLRRAFPHAKVFSIAIAARYHAMCLDVERLDAVPTEAPAWVRLVRADRSIPKVDGRACVYGSLSDWTTAIQPILTRAGIPRSWYWKFDADYTFVPHVDLGFDATQYTDHALGRNLDESLATYAFVGKVAKRKPSRPVCFGAHTQRTKLCAGVRSKVAADARAAASSQRVYVRRSCPELARRDLYFSTVLRKHPRTKTARRRSALRATRRAEHQRSCGTFRRRATVFSNQAAALTRQYS